MCGMTMNGGSSIVATNYSERFSARLVSRHGECEKIASVHHNLSGHARISFYVLPCHVDFGTTNILRRKKHLAIQVTDFDYVWINKGKSRYSDSQKLKNNITANPADSDDEGM